MFDVGEVSKKKVKPKMKKKRRSNMSNDTKKIIAICVTIFIVIFLISYIFIRKQNENYNNIKEDKNNYLVYTKYSKNSKTYPVHVPYINIKSSVVSQINEDIDLFTSEFINAKKCVILYEYDISGIILSLVVKVVDYNTEYAPQVYFRSYNINLTTLEAIADSALLDFFQTDEVAVESLIENQFRYYYQELVKEQYYQADECSYDCFLKYREVDNYLDRLSYYVQNGDLIAYKPFVFHSIYGEEEFFKDDDFKFMLVQTEKE